MRAASSGRRGVSPWCSPTELLSTGYAEAVRSWLKSKFRSVHMVLFEELQFDEATEKVVLVLARGSGGCRAFSLVPVHTAEDLPDIRFGGPNHLSVPAPQKGKWTDFLLPVEHRQVYDRVVEGTSCRQRSTGRRHSARSPATTTTSVSPRTSAASSGISERHLCAAVPPGTRHFRGLAFSRKDWEALRERGDQRVWMLQPQDETLGGREESDDEGLRRYLTEGVIAEVHQAYTSAAYGPPGIALRLCPAPDLFFTYMSHRYRGC